MKAVAVLASAIAAFWGAALAQPVVNPTGVVPNLSFQNVDPVIRSFDQSITYVNIGGVRAMRIENRGRIVLLIENGCSPTGCAGMRLLAAFNETASPETINRFNATTPVARAYLNPNGQVELMHYIIADYGITRGSLIVNIGAFMGAIDKWAGDFSTGNLSNSVSFDPLITEDNIEQHLSQAAMDAMWADETLINGGISNDVTGDR